MVDSAREKRGGAEVKSDDAPTPVVGGNDVAPAKSIKAPAFQYYPKDFLTDSNVLAMSLTEIGAYWKLISICWIDDTLPTSIEALARLVGIPHKHFSRLWPALAPCFKEKGGRLTHPRLERERAAQAAYRAKQTDNGKKGGRPRNPSLSPEKAVGFSGETQTQPTKSSSSAICDLQSSSAVKRHTPGAPIHVSHRNHAACGLVCVPSALHEQFRKARRHDGADMELRAWYLAVDHEWSPGGARSGEPVDVDEFRFWRTRYAEKWPAADRKHIPIGQRWRPSDEAAS